MALEVGTAHLQVIPSLRGLHKTIAAEVAKIQDVTIGVQPKTDQFRRGVERATRGIRGVKVPVAADTTPARRDLADLKDEANRLRGVKLQITSDSTRARADLNALKRELADLRKQPASVEVTAEITTAERKIAELETLLATLKDSRVNVDADIAAARVKVAELTEEIRTADADIEIGTDTSSADRDIDNFTGQIRAQLTDAINSLPPIRIGSDTSDAAAKVNAFVTDTRARLLSLIRALPSIKITAEADMASALSAIASIESQLASIQDKDVRVTAHADFSAVANAVALLERELTGIGDKHVTVTVDTDSGVANLRALSREAATAGSTLERLASVAGDTMGTRFGLMAASILPLLESIGQLSGALGLLPGVAMGAATALGAVVIGSQGLGDAFKAQAAAEKAATEATRLTTGTLAESEAAQRRATKAADEYAATLTNLAPSARSFVSAVIQLKPAFNDLRLDVQQHLFEGIGDAMLNLGRTALPVVRRGLVQMADGINSAVLKFSEFASSKEAVDDYTQIFNNIGSAAAILASAVKPILQIFTDVAVVGSEFLPGLATNFAAAAQRAAEFVREARDTGQLHEWIKTGMEAVKLLWAAFKDVVAIIKELASNSPFGPSFLEALAAVTGSIRWLIENVPGLTSLVNIFFGAWLFAKILGGLAGMVTTIGTVAGALKGATTDVTGFGDKSKAAGDKSVAAAGAAKSAWVTAGLAIAGAVAAGAALRAGGEDVTNPDELANASGWVRLRDAMDTAGKLLTGDFKGFADGIRTSWDASMTAMEQRTHEYSGTTSGVISGLLTKIGLWFAEPKTVTFNADAADALTKGEAVGNSVLAVPQDWLTRFVGDPAGLNTAIAQATGGISAVTPEHWTGFFGDTGNILAAAGTATGAANSVPQPPTAVFSGDPNQAVAAAGAATGAINSVPDRSDTNINADTNADSVVANVRRWLDGINGHTVRTFIDTVQRFLPGVAGGAILAPMALGGVLAMDQGDMLDRARPMSARTARIVPPNTPRLIGDNMTDDESFIPINDSAWSTAILRETARRKRFALVPMAGGGQLRPGDVVVEDDPRWLQATPGPGLVWGNPGQHIRAGQLASKGSSVIGFSLTAMAHGGINETGMALYLRRKAVFDRHRRQWARTHPGQENTNTTVRQFWPEYADAVERGYRGTVKQFYSQYTPHDSGRHSGGAPGGIGGAPGEVAVGRPMSKVLTSRFATATGMASVTRNNPLYAPTPWTAPTPWRDTTGGGRGRAIHINTNSALIRELLELVRKEIRVQGGDVQLVLGR